jgi:ubiquinone/menaquinone biosynthesis C-methylase UbiE
METWRQVMEQEWDARARSNAMHYIKSARRVWDVEEFFQSGQQEVEDFTDELFAEMDFDPTTARMLEIGCGLGRMTKAFASKFSEVHAIDISSEMIEQGRVLLQEVPNIRWRTSSGVNLAEYADNTFDFVFSYIVFQHIPKREIVLNYVTEIGRVLRPGGVFKFQVFTDAGSLTGWIERVRTLVAFHTWRLLWRYFRVSREYLLGEPDPLEIHDELKAERYQSWLGNSVPVVRLINTLEAAGLEFLITNACTQYTWVSGRKRSSGRNRAS